jgi:hypothetical protein
MKNKIYSLMITFMVATTMCSCNLQSKIDLQSVIGKNIDEVFEIFLMMLLIGRWLLINRHTKLTV